MIEGYHCILGTYGFWLPNDPRGSWSDFVGSWNLYRIGGRATHTNARRSRASVAVTTGDRQRDSSARSRMRFPPVVFDGRQARAVGKGFSIAGRAAGYQIHACAIMPQHVHLLVGRSRNEISLVMGSLKRFATMELYRQGLHPSQRGSPAGSPVWARGGWSVYLECTDIVRVVRYIEENPIHEGLPAQQWSFVTPWRGSI